MILLFSYFLFLWNSQNFLQLKMDFICIITSFDCLTKNNSMQTLMLNCAFKIFLLPRLCWSALSLIYHSLLLSQSLPSLHATFQRKEKMEDIFTHSLTFYLEVLFSACSPFSIFFFLFGKLKMKGRKGKKRLTCQENVVAMLKPLFFWFLIEVRSCMSKWVQHQNQQNPFKSCKNCGKCGFVRIWRSLRGVGLNNFKKPPDRHDLQNLKVWKHPTIYRSHLMFEIFLPTSITAAWSVCMFK